jgi:hypothetical protein
MVCGHVIHLDCAYAQYRVAQLAGVIVKPRCGFPSCTAIPEHLLLHNNLTVWRPILVKVEELISMIIFEEHLDLEVDHVNNPLSDYFEKPELFARATNA